MHDLLADVVERAAIGIAIGTPNRADIEFAYANAPFRDVLGLPSGPIPMNDVLRAFGSDEAARIRLGVARACAGDRVELESDLRPSAGGARVRLACLPLDGGTRVAIALQRLERERSVERQFRLLAQALRQSGDLVVIFDGVPVPARGPAIRYVNDAVLGTLGYDRSDLIGKPYATFFGPRTHPRVRERIAEQIARAETIAQELLVRRKDGSHIWVEFVAQPVLGADGLPEYWISVGRDITVRRRAASQTAQLLATVDQLDTPVTIYAVGGDGELEVTYENAAAAERGPCGFAQLLKNPAKPGRARALLEGLRRGETVRTLAANGSHLAITEARATLDEDGRIDAILCTERSNGEGAANPSIVRAVDLGRSCARLTDGAERLEALRHVLETEFRMQLDPGLTTHNGARNGEVRIDPFGRCATFSIAGPNGMVRHAAVRWRDERAHGDLTALRLLLETASSE